MTLAPLAPGAAAARASAGSEVVSVIIVVVAVIVLVLLVLGWRLRSAGGGSWRSSRTRQIQEAAAEDVAAVREDAKWFGPDAPGNYPDEL